MRTKTKKIPVLGGTRKGKVEKTKTLNSKKDYTSMKSKKQVKKKDERKEVWTIILYPDSAVKNWEIILDMEHIKWAESPLHDKDVNEATGEIKKPHKHIMLQFTSKKSEKQIEKICEKIKAVRPEGCESKSCMLRYFAHLDNKEKYQYDPLEIIGHNGFDVEEGLKLTSKEKQEELSDLWEFIENKGIKYFNNLIKIVNAEYRQYRKIVYDHHKTFIILNYLKEKRYEEKDLRELEAYGSNYNVRCQKSKQEDENSQKYCKININETLYDKQNIEGQIQQKNEMSKYVIVDSTANCDYGKIVKTCKSIEEAKYELEKNYNTGIYYINEKEKFENIML